jgi:hypothetical protein
MSSTLIDDHIIIHNDVKCYLLDILEAEMIQQMYINILIDMLYVKILYRILYVLAVCIFNLHSLDEFTMHVNVSIFANEG